MTAVDSTDGGQTLAVLVAELLQARGVGWVFGLQGGHIQPIWDHVARRGLRIVDVRDEGAAVHMAQAYAELTGGFGVAMTTAGPGVTNTVTAVANAHIARTPLLLIGGCPPRPQVNMGPLQDIPHVEILRPITRQARTVPVAEQALRELDEAIARPLGDGGEPGPVYLEFPTDVLVVGTELRWCDYAGLARALGAHGERVDAPDELPAALERAFANAPALVEVLVSRDAISSDSNKGLSLVPDYQALTTWDDAERARRSLSVQV